jgi:RNA 2',3'-cyclic 3'-phosphodiesterase
MRLFTAIDIPAEIRARLRAFVDRLRPAAKLSWSAVDNLHVTTKFIGEWPEARLQEVKDTLAKVPKAGPLEIGVGGFGWFPNPKNPRVFWVGIRGGEALLKLSKDTEQNLAAIGVAVEDRDFHPHLTLARRRDPVPLGDLRRVLDSLEAGAGEFGSFRATSFSLYLSAGGKYTRLQEFPLVS